jgi:TonB family protein
VMLIRKTAPSQGSRTRIAELADSEITFSFFHFIFIGNASGLSDFEKQRIIDHENTHAQQWHSVDMLLLRLLQIVFWFNPLISIYKKIFVQVHEFEADARAVENQDVNRYCSLLARVALQSAGLSIANHFNNSLTLKRIQMMRTIKSGIKRWKLATCAVAIPLLFFAIACQDQIADKESANLPEEVQTRFEVFKQNYPGENFIVEYGENAEIRLTELEAQFGHARHIELITVKVDGKERTFSMLQFVKNQNTLSASDEVYENVDEMAEYDGGMPGLISYLSSNIRYPATAREQGIEGTTFVSFIIEKNGSISDVKVQKGFDEACDVESERVVKAMTNWKPAKHQGEIVRSRLTLPIKFKLN